MENQIKTSVIIPVYNTENYIDECIQSVLNQTQKELEIILVDDGSTDNSGEIIDRYVKKYNNIFAVHQENQKLGSARNTGVKQAKGEYIYFLDSDDYIANNMLEQCYICAKKNNLDFLFFDAWTFWEGEDKLTFEYDRSGINIERDIFKGKEYWLKYYKCKGIYSCAPLTYIKKEYINSYDIKFEPGIFYEDMDWIVRMYRNANRIKYCPSKFYYRRCRTGSIMKSKFSYMHFYSAVYSFWKLIELYSIYDDRESKQMVEDILNIMIYRVQDIIINIDISLISNDLFVFIERLLSEDNKLNLLNENLNVKISNLINACWKYINKESFESIELIEKIISHQNQISNCIKNRYKLQEFINIAIYGIGKMCDEIFDWYEKKEIAVNANIRFIVTKTETDTYIGYPVSEIEEMKDTEFDHIIIASTKFAEEMKKNLQINNIVAKEYFITFGNLNG